MPYTKAQILLDLDTMLVTFKALLYASRVTFESGLVNIRNFNVMNNCRGEIGVLEGAPFADIVATSQGLQDLLTSCGVFSRSYLLITAYERVKGYCENGPYPDNAKKLLDRSNHKFRDALLAIRTLRGTATHWKPEGIIDWKDYYPKKISVHGIELRQGLKEKDIHLTDFSLFNLILELRQFVEEILE